MPRGNPQYLRRGGPGRPKGSKNKRTKEMAALWEEFLASDGYIDSAKLRVVRGKAPHLESYWLNQIIGKPVERHDIRGELKLPTVIDELHRES